MTLEEALSENTGLRAQIATLETAQDRINRESKTHRLNAEAFQKQADEFRLKADEAQQKLSEVTVGHASEVEKIKLDLTARATTAEAQAAKAAEAAHGQVLMAKLESAAEKAGISDLAYLKIFDDRTSLKADPDGKVLDAEGKPLDVGAWFAAKKEAYPHLFGLAAKPGTSTGTTSSTVDPPRPGPAAGFDARTAEPKDYATRRREMLAASAPHR